MSAVDTCSPRVAMSESVLDKLAHVLGDVVSALFQPGMHPDQAIGAIAPEHEDLTNLKRGHPGCLEAHLPPSPPRLIPDGPCDPIELRAREGPPHLHDLRTPAADVVDRGRVEDGGPVDPRRGVLNAAGLRVPAFDDDDVRLGLYSGKGHRVPVGRQVGRVVDRVRVRIERHGWRGEILAWEIEEGAVEPKTRIPAAVKILNPLDEAGGGVAIEGPPSLLQV